MGLDYRIASVFFQPEDAKRFFVPDKYKMSMGNERWYNGEEWIEFVQPLFDFFENEDFCPIVPENIAELQDMDDDEHYKLFKELLILLANVEGIAFYLTYYY